jgi:hypothetical protein
LDQLKEDVMNRSIALTVALLGVGTTFSSDNAAAGHILNGQVSQDRTLVIWKADGVTIAPLPDMTPTMVVFYPSEITPGESTRRFEVAQRRCPNGRC